MRRRSGSRTHRPRPATWARPAPPAERGAASAGLLGGLLRGRLLGRALLRRRLLRVLARGGLLGAVLGRRLLLRGGLLLGAFLAFALGGLAARRLRRVDAALEGSEQVHDLAGLRLLLRGVLDLAALELGLHQRLDRR